MTLYGIPNCDTVRKARKWLDSHQVSYTFIDFRKDNFTENDLQAWLKLCEFNDILNPKSTAWKSLTASQIQAVKTDQTLSLLLEYPTLIKRPVLLMENAILFGFNESRYQELFA